MADPVFKYITSNPFGLSGFKPDFADIDGDGDLDAFSGAQGDTLFFRNTGTVSSPIFAAAITNPFGFNDLGSPAILTLVDIDGDGDLDAFKGNQAGNTLFFRNTGTISIPLFAAPQTNPFGLSDVDSNAYPTLVDIDGDGDLDAFVGAFNGNTQFFRNTGTVSNPTFAGAVTNPFGLIDVGGYASPAFVDIDGDGDLDAFIGYGDYFSGDGGFVFFRNTGTTSNPVYYRDSSTPFGLSQVDSSILTFADIDGDYDLDAFLSSTEFFQNAGTGYSTHFSREHK